MGTDDTGRSDDDRDGNKSTGRRGEDMAFPEDFRKLMRRFFGPWNRRRYRRRMILAGASGAG